LWTPAACIFGGDVVMPPKEQLLNVVALFLSALTQPFLYLSHHF